MPAAHALIIDAGVARLVVGRLLHDCSISFAVVGAADTDGGHLKKTEPLGDFALAGQNSPNLCTPPTVRCETP
jgi:hypothetical protein